MKLITRSVYFYINSCFHVISVLPIDLCEADTMDGDSAAASERILLEPYKYLLQLPGESL